MPEQHPDCASQRLSRSAQRIALVCALLTICQSAAGQQEVAYQPPARAPQDPAALAVSDTGAPLESALFRALLVPRRQAMISSMITGRIDRIHFELGDRFERGDTMVSFDCGVLKASRDSARAELRQFELTHTANEELRGDGAVSALDLSLSRAKVEQGKAELRLAKAQLDKCVIKAPFAGTVSGRHVQEFETVALGDPLLSVIDDSIMEVYVHLPSKWAGSVDPGAVFSIAVDETGKTYRALIERISPQIDATSRTFTVTAKLLGTNRELRAGMSGSASFPELQ